jgi:hypothetical protein
VTVPPLAPGFSGGYTTQTQAAEHIASIPTFQPERKARYRRAFGLQQSNVGLIDCLQAGAVSMPESERVFDSDCPYCQLRREIIVCPPCGLTFADVDGPNNINDRSRHLKAYQFLRWKRYFSDGSAPHRQSSLAWKDPREPAGLAVGIRCRYSFSRLL